MPPLPEPVVESVKSPAGQPSWRTAWWLAIRPRTLTISLSPVLVGNAIAYAEAGNFVFWPALAALLSALLIQIGTNLHNDVSDFERGADTAERLGPPRATAMGWLSPQAVRYGAWLAFALAFLLGVLLVFRGGWPIVIIGLASLLAGWAYTSGPRPIAYTPLGEAFVVLFFGFAAVCGSYYLQSLLVSPASIIAGLIVGAFAAAVMSVNNTRDRSTDKAAGKRTLAVFVGSKVMRWVYTAEMLLPFLLLPLLAVTMGRGGWMALPCLAAGAAINLSRRFKAATGGPAYNQLLAETARLQAVFSLLLVTALLV